MNESFPTDSLFRRSVLAYLIARRTIAEWDAVKHRIDQRIRDLPHRVIENCRLLIAGEITGDQARDYDMIDEMEYAMSFSNEVGPPAWCPLACHAAIRCASSHEEAVYKEHFYDSVWESNFIETCREDDDDWQGWDAHFWGACVAGGLAGLEGFNAENRRKFWDQWLTNDIVAVIGDIETVNALFWENEK